jgi:hypothetical protein
VGRPHYRTLVNAPGSHPPITLAGRLDLGLNGCLVIQENHQDDMPPQLSRAEWLGVKPLGPAERRHVPTSEYGHLRRGHSSGSVRSQERPQRRQRLLGGLLGEPVAGAGNDRALHVVCEALHRVADLCAVA